MTGTAYVDYRLELTIFSCDENQEQGYLCLLQCFMCPRYMTAGGRWEDLAAAALQAADWLNTGYGAAPPHNRATKMRCRMAERSEFLPN